MRSTPLSPCCSIDLKVCRASLLMTARMRRYCRIVVSLGIFLKGDCSEAREDSSFGHMTGVKPSPKNIKEEGRPSYKESR